MSNRKYNPPNTGELSPQQVRAIERAARKFRDKMQRMVDNSPGVDGVSITFGDHDPIEVARKEQRRTP